VDHPARGQPAAAGRHSQPDGKPVGQRRVAQPATLLQELRAGGSMDGAVDATAAEQ
jgi:hypothetical protein